LEFLGDVMSGEIIRAGDKTSHGGIVVEGSQTDICMGKPIAFIGHMTFCPKCKGNFPIIEGVMTVTFYGRGVAVAGMKTACGASLLASQFTDTVQRGSGAGNKVLAGSSGVMAKKTVSEVTQPSATDGEEGIETEHFYSLLDEQGLPIDGYHHDLQVAEELYTRAGDYSDGHTATVNGEKTSRLVTWLSRDSGARV
jgi:uncharacterized Zn-binding protein involved in type VI secretion